MTGLRIAGGRRCRSTSDSNGAYVVVQLVPDQTTMMNWLRRFQFFFRLDDHMHSRTDQLGLGIDFLAEGAYAISPGSTS